MRDFAIIVAVDQALGVGLSGGMPWQLPGDMAYFKRITSEAPATLRNAVIMGRKTYDSIPARFRPLAGRLNVVLSRGPLALEPEVLCASSLETALDQLDATAGLHRLFVIGGGEIYRQALLSPHCKALYVTRIQANFACDTHFPGFEGAFTRVTQSDLKHDKGIDYTFEVYERRA